MWRKFFKSNSALVDDIMDTLSSVSDTDIYPPLDDVFEMFNHMKPKDVRVLIIGQSPYVGEDACGIPFVSAVGRNTQSLKKIAEEIKHEYPYLVIPNGSNLNKIINHWIDQGVFLVNCSMTTSATLDHSVMWEEFVREIIRYMEPSVPVVLMGSVAWSLSTSVRGRNVIKVPHPVARDNSFIGCNVFTRCNSYLGNNPVLWLPPEF